MTGQPGTAPPPSERGRNAERRAPEGVGVFRLAGWGLGFSIALALLVGIVILVGYLLDDPGRNPAPEAYAAAVCGAASELSAGTDALAEGVEGRGNVGGREAARTEVLGHVGAANEALAGLPDWSPGRSLNELIGSQIITLTNGAQALDEGPVEEDLQTALGTQADIDAQLSGGRYGFDCG